MVSFVHGSDPNFEIINHLDKDIVTSTGPRNRYIVPAAIVAVDVEGSVVTFDKSDCPPLIPSVSDAEK